MPRRLSLIRYGMGLARRGRGWLVLLACGCSFAQQSGPASPAFDVASVKQNKSDGAEFSSNVPLGPGNVYSPTGGVLTVRNVPLMMYIEFAYRMTDTEAAAIEKHAPAWVMSDRFDVQARTEKVDVTKNELRLMMRALLADRFGLQVHKQTRDTAVYALVLAEPGKLGPGLRLHPAGATCVGTDTMHAGEWPELQAKGFPAVCGGIVGLPGAGAGQVRLGGSKVTTGLLADSFRSWGQLERPIVDRTGINDTVDFVLEYAPLQGPEADAGETTGPRFQEALKKQLGLKLEAGRAPVGMLVMDRVERLKEN